MQLPQIPEHVITSGRNPASLSSHSPLPRGLLDPRVMTLIPPARAVTTGRVKSQFLVNCVCFWGWTILFGGCPTHCKMSGNIFGFSWLDASCNQLLPKFQRYFKIKSVSRHCQAPAPPGGKITATESQWHRLWEASQSGFKPAGMLWCGPTLSQIPNPQCTSQLGLWDNLHLTWEFNYVHISSFRSICNFLNIYVMLLKLHPTKHRDPWIFFF